MGPAHIHHDSSKLCQSRRRFICGLAALGALSVNPALANFVAPLTGCRSLKLNNLHTGETISTIYWENGQYHEQALLELNHVLRDHRSNEVSDIDRNLLDMLAELQNSTGNTNPWDVISAFRSESTNAKLRKAGSGVAKKSYHCLGRAIDVRLPGTALTDLHKAALAMKSGGVGYYPKSDFVHVDTGPVRRW
ncbi:MAG: DUF882 domain-containing protein [Pseudomonadota bacterium]